MYTRLESDIQHRVQTIDLPHNTALLLTGLSTLFNHPIISSYNDSVIANERQRGFQEEEFDKM